MTQHFDVLPHVPDEIARAFLSTDLVWNCFTLADLAPPYSEHARFPVAAGTDGQILATCLLYDFPGDRSLVPFGSADGIRAILRAVDLPEQTFVVARETDWPVVSEFFAPVVDPRTMHRMSVSRSRFRPVALDRDLEIMRVERAQYEEVDALFALWGGITTDLFPEGRIFGVRDGEGRLCAVALAMAANGLDGIGTIGGVFTDPALRGRGPGKAVLTMVCRYWFDRGRKEIYLNVHSENAAARNAYRALGYVDRMWYCVCPARHRRRVIHP